MGDTACNDVTITITHVDNGYILKFIDIPFDTGVPIEKTFLYEDDEETHEHVVQLLYDVLDIFSETGKDSRKRVVQVKSKRIKE